MVLDLLIGRPGTTQVLIIVAVIVLLFGAAKVPELARSLGKAKGEFQRGLKEGENDQSKKDEDKEEDEATTASKTQ